MRDNPATAVYVAFASEELQLDWIPDEARVIVVHNDHRLPDARCSHPNVEHLRGHGNVGFGVGVNLALSRIDRGRVVICNPDTKLTPAHWQALAHAKPHEVVSIPLEDGRGVPQPVVNRYPTPVSLVLTGWRAGRLFQRGTWLRDAGVRMIGQWGQQHAAGQKQTPGEWSLTTHWPSAAVCSIDHDRLAGVDGFDPGYFLYLEDADLSARLARRFPDSVVRLAAVQPGVHFVGGSGSSGSRKIDQHQLESAIRYAHQRRGVAWRIAEGALRLRQQWIGAPAQ